MHGALGYALSQGPCKRHLVTVAHISRFSGSGKLAHTKRSMSSAVSIFLSFERIRRRWICGRPRFWYSRVHMCAIVCPNHPVLVSPFRRALTLILKSRDTISVRSYTVCPARSLSGIQIRFGLHVKVTNTCSKPSDRKIAIASWYRCRMKRGEPGYEAGSTRRRPASALLVSKSSATKSQIPW